MTAGRADKLIYVGLGQTLTTMVVRVYFNFATTASGAFLGQCRVHWKITPQVATYPDTSLNHVLEDFLDKLAGWWQGASQYMSSALKLNSMVAEIVEGPTAEAQIVTDYAGRVVTGPVPPQCAVLVSLSCAKRGRRFRNRAYWPGLAKTEHDGGGVDETTTRRIEQLYTNWSRQPFIALTNPRQNWTMQLGVWSQAGSGGSPAAEFNPVTGIAIRGNLATQRRRQRALFQ